MSSTSNFLNSDSSDDDIPVRTQVQVEVHYQPEHNVSPTNTPPPVDIPPQNISPANSPPPGDILPQNISPANSPPPVDILPQDISPVNSPPPVDNLPPADIPNANLDWLEYPAEDLLSVITWRPKGEDEEIGDDPRKYRCPVCYVNRFRYILLCGHGLCGQCAERIYLESHQCPVCRQIIQMDPIRIMM
ncbi:hypothetical protein CBL_08459 [Carabus blaptoides fortunei]